MKRDSLNLVCKAFKNWGIKSVLLIVLQISFLGLVHSQSHLDIGRQLIVESNYDSAIVVLNQGIDNCGQCTDSVLAYSHVALGRAYLLERDLEKSMQNYLKAKTIFKTTQNQLGLAHVYTVIGEFYRFQVRYDEAFENLNNALEIHKNHKLPSNSLAKIYNRLAAVINETKGDKDEVIRYSKMAMELSDHNEIYASSLREIANVYEASDKEKALEYYFESLEIYKKNKNTRYVADLYFVIARFYFQSKKYKKSIEYCDLGLDISEKNKWKVVSRDLLFYKYKSLIELGSYRESNKIMEKHFQYVYDVGAIEYSKELRRVESEYQLTEKERQILIEKEKTRALEEKNEEQKSDFIRVVILSSILAVLLLSILFLVYRLNKTNNELKKSINQKEALVQEVHHRIKNNLSVLNSLLYLQAEESEDEIVQNSLSQTRSRIQSMAVVHQNLYDVDDASKINFADFVNELIQESKEINGYEKLEVKLNVTVKRPWIEMNTAVLIGLILNELLTNSFKYAWNKNEQNQVLISLKNLDDDFLVSYSDSNETNNIAIDLNNSEGFGFKLIRILVKQLKASFWYDQEENTFYLKMKKI